MQLVAWPVQNFIVAATMTFIWSLTQNSSRFCVLCAGMWKELFFIDILYYLQLISRVKLYVSYR